jgi:hypothetical protein
MGVYNLAEVNTEPGNEATCPFSPPLGWEGDESAYLELMRQRYKNRNFNQLIIGTVWCSKKNGHTLLWAVCRTSSSDC